MCKTIIELSVLAGILLLIGCSGSDTSASYYNVWPTAIVGQSKIAFENEIVTLSGEGEDVDGEIVSYKWSQVSGTSVAFEGGDTQYLSFVAPETSHQQQVLAFKLTVVDDKGAESADVVQIIVKPAMSKENAKSASIAKVNPVVSYGGEVIAVNQ